MRSLESKRKILDYKNDNDSIAQDISQKLASGNKENSNYFRPDSSEDLLQTIEENLAKMESIKSAYPKKDRTSDEYKNQSEKIEFLKRMGLFTEQEAGKATIHSSLDAKESASEYEKGLEELEKSMKALQEL